MIVTPQSGNAIGYKLVWIFAHLAIKARCQHGGCRRADCVFGVAKPGKLRRKFNGGDPFAPARKVSQFVYLFEHVGIYNAFATTAR